MGSFLRRTQNLKIRHKNSPLKYKELNNEPKRREMTENETYLIQKFYNLKPFESAKIGDLYTYTRVPGGWLVESVMVNNQGITFIPNNEEFLIQSIVVPRSSDA